MNVKKIIPLLLIFFFAYPNLPCYSQNRNNRVADTIKTSAKDTLTNDLSKLGVLKDEELFLNITAIEIDEIKNVPEIRLYVEFNWNTDPFWTLEDIINVSLPDGWIVKDASLEVTHLFSNGTTKTKTYTDYQINDNALSFEFDIQKAADIYGYAIIKLSCNDIKLLQENKISSARVDYYHKVREYLIRTGYCSLSKTVNWKNSDLIH